MSTFTRNAAALVGILASAVSFASGAEAQGVQLINQCDRLCANNPRAICYAACLGSGNGVLQQKKAPPVRVQPVSVISSYGDWRNAVYNSTSPGGIGRGSAGGGNGGGGGKAK